MQLYKSRGFGEYFQDTFSFIKQNGGHLYKNFFIINGVFILILMGLGYFVSNFYTEIIFGGIANENPNAVENYINENSGLFILFFLVFVLVGFMSMIISYSYIPIYLKLYAKNNNKEFNTSDIINQYKMNIGRIFIYLLCSIVLVIPIFIIAGIASFVLAITIIGILLLPLIIGLVSLFYQSTLIEYIEGKKGIWECFGYSLSLISSKFWAAVGCVGLFFLMNYIIQNVIVLIPYFAFIIDMLAGVETGGTPDPQELSKSLSIIMIVMFVLTYFVGLILNIILQLNQGIVFYSLKEDRENINTKSDIDLIGASE